VEAAEAERVEPVCLRISSFFMREVLCSPMASHNDVSALSFLHLLRYLYFLAQQSLQVCQKLLYHKLSDLMTTESASQEYRTNATLGQNFAQYLISSTFRNRQAKIGIFNRLKIWAKC
jgi:hypothetical protein